MVGGAGWAFVGAPLRDDSKGKQDKRKVTPRMKGRGSGLDSGKKNVDLYGSRKIIRIPTAWRGYKNT